MSILDERTDREKTVNVKEENVCIVILNHDLSDVQKEYLKENYNVSKYVYLPDNLKNIWGNINPDNKDVTEYVDKIFNFIKDVCLVEKKYFVVIQGEYVCTYNIVKRIENELENVVALAATSIRETVEVEDGNVKICEFVFKLFREYFNRG